MRLSEATLSDLTTRLERLLAGCGSLPVPREDLVGEVILKLLAAAAAREVRNPYAYARTILQNLVRDQIRRAERAQRALEALSRSAPSAAAGDTDRLDDGELLGYLLERTELSPLQAQVVRMVYLDGMTLTETARELSKNPGTIHRHLGRALEKLERRAAELELQR